MGRSPGEGEDNQDVKDHEGRNRRKRPKDDDEKMIADQVDQRHGDMASTGRSLYECRCLGDVESDIQADEY